MKPPILVLSLGMLAFAAPAFAQDMPTPSPQMRQQFEQMHAKMKAIRVTERSQILASLTPAHRSLLASTAGQLATTADPDYENAARRLDAILTPAEQQAVLRADQDARTAQRGLMEQMRSDMPAPPGAVRGGGPQTTDRFYDNTTPDAGKVLLRVMLSGQEMHFMIRTKAVPF